VTEREGDFEGFHNVCTVWRGRMQGAATPSMLPQQQQREAMDVLQRLAALSGASRPESWAQLAAMTSVGANSNVQLPPLSSSLMGHAPFGNDSAVSQALLQHYWANYLQQQQQQQQGLPRGGSGALAPDAILAALQAQQQQQPQAEGLNLPAFQQGLAALLSPSQQRTSLPPSSGVSQPSDILPTSSVAPRQKRNLEQLVQAAEEAGEVREARSETSGSCSSPDSKDGEVKKASRRRWVQSVLSESSAFVQWRRPFCYWLPRSQHMYTQFGMTLQEGDSHSGA